MTFREQSNATNGRKRRNERRGRKELSVGEKSVSDSEREVMSVVGFRCTVVEKDCIWLNKGGI